MKISLVGFGHLGKWHAEKLTMLYGPNFHSIVEIDTSKHQSIRQNFTEQKIVHHLSEVIDDIDAVVIATPTTYHYQVILEAINKDKHCFVEKPMTATLQESIDIGDLLSKKDIIFQVGHSERFHALWEEVMEKEKFSNCRIARFDRLAPYKGRGDDVDIIYDLMIHDYDLLTLLGFGTPLTVEAWGQSCHTKMIDYCSSKLTYPNGVVFVTASRSSINEKRSAEFVFDDGVLEVDLIHERVKRSYSFKEINESKFEKRDHLLEEHKVFKSSIEKGKNNSINYNVGHIAMKIMDMTLRSIREKEKISWS